MKLAQQLALGLVALGAATMGMTGVARADHRSELARLEAAACDLHESAHAFHDVVKGCPYCNRLTAQACSLVESVEHFQTDVKRGLPVPHLEGVLAQINRQIDLLDRAMTYTGCRTHRFEARRRWRDVNSAVQLVDLRLDALRDCGSPGNGGPGHGGGPFNGGPFNGGPGNHGPFPGGGRPGSGPIGGGPGHSGGHGSHGPSHGGSPGPSRPADIWARLIINLLD